MLPVLMSGGTKPLEIDQARRDNADDLQKNIAAIKNMLNGKKSALPHDSVSFSQALIKMQQDQK